MIGSMSPIQEPLPETIEPYNICQAAAEQTGTPVAQVLTAMGSISNLYCLFALAQADVDSVRTNFQGFTSEKFAPRIAVLGEIRKALPGIPDGQPEVILSALTQSLDSLFRATRCVRGRLRGFGLLTPLNLDRSEYSLRVELPLRAELRAQSKQWEESERTGSGASSSAGD